MKKSKRVLAGAGLIMSLSVLTSCSLIKNSELCGLPAPSRDNDQMPAPAYAVTEAPTEAPDFPVAVYGPPEWFEQDTVDPEWPEDVYGPPEWFDEPEEADPEYPDLVYGPPDGGFEWSSDW